MFQIRQKVLGDKKRRSGRKSRPGLRFIRPRLEALEDRLAPSVFNVNTTLDTLAVNFTSGQDSTGHVSLRSAVQAANVVGGVSNTINLPAGNYLLTLNASRGSLPITNNLTINGAGAASTTINGNAQDRIFQISPGFTVAITNVTLVNGQVRGTVASPAQGGAVFDSGALTLSNDIIAANLAIGAKGPDGANGANGTLGTPGSPGGNGQTGGDAQGGAIYLDNSSGAGLTIVNCQFNNNSALPGHGGNGGQGGSGGTGIDIAGADGGAGGNGGSAGIAFGGAVYNAGGALVIQGSYFSGNTAGPLFIFPVVGGGSGGTGGSGGPGIGATSDGGNGGIGGTGGDSGLDEGGAIYNSQTGNVAITDSSFSGNFAIAPEAGPGGPGGGIVPEESAYTGSGGAGGSGGGAIGGAIFDVGTMKIDSCSIFSNQAIGGIGGPGGNSIAIPGAIELFGGNGGTGGTALGGGIANVSGALALAHITLSLNSSVPGPGGAGGSGLRPGSAGAAGGALAGGFFSFVGGSFGGGPSQAWDTIIAGDSATSSADVLGNFLSQGHNLIGDGTGSSGFTAPGDQVGTASSPINPLLGPPGNNGGPTPTLVPEPGSPAIDAGDGTNAPATDHRGLSRIVNGDANFDPEFICSLFCIPIPGTNDGAIIDIGAVEFQPTNLTVSVSASPSSASPGGTVAYTITLKSGKGDNNALNVTLTDSVPAQTTFQSFTAPAGWIVTQPAVGGTGTVKATFVSLAPNSTASFTLKVKVNSAPTAKSTTDTVTVSTTSPESSTAGNSASTATTILVGLLAVGADAGGEPEVKVYDPQNGLLRYDFLAFDPSFHGGVRVAIGDVNGDGIPDIIAAQGPGDGASGDSLVHVYDGTTGQSLAGPLGSFDPFPGFHGGLYVASADLNGDGFFDVVVAEDAGGQPRIKVFSGKDGGVLADFLAFAPGFHGGVRVAAADVNHDGHADIVAGAGPGGAPQVVVFEGSDLAQGITKPALSFDAYQPSFTGGVYVAAGDVHGDGIRKILTGAGAGDEPRVRVFDGRNGQLLQSFLAFDPAFRGGVRVAAADVNGDGRPDIVAAEGPGGLPHVRGFDGLSLTRLDQFFAFDADFRGGIFVGGGGRWPVLHPAEQDDDGPLPFDSQTGALPELPLDAPLLAETEPDGATNPSAPTAADVHAAALAAFLAEEMTGGTLPLLWHGLPTVPRGTQVRPAPRTEGPWWLSAPLEEPALWEELLEMVL